MSSTTRLVTSVTVAAMAVVGAVSVSNLSTSNVTGKKAMGQTAAARLLDQATFGASYDAISAAANVSYNQWFSDQKSAAPSLTTPLVLQTQGDNYGGWTHYWWRNAVRGQDQLRQRMAFALSEIFVVSGTPDNQLGVPINQATFYDVLVNDSLGNYRKLLEDVTLNPEMGLYLNMFRNDKPDASVGRHADENYAREVMQLFSVGLVQLNIDGTPVLDSNGHTIPTYDQSQVAGMARVFTGWASQPSSDTSDSWQYAQNYTAPMAPYQAHHDIGSKTILNNVVVPANGTPQADLKIALDTIFNHPNVGPFIAKQLIQRLVTSNPSPAYVARVAQIFNDNTRGVRGDLFAVARAILTDPEALNVGGSTSGKLREPLIRLTHLWRAFDAGDDASDINDGEVATTALDIFAQSPLRAPSVFNFFVPDYVRAGPLAKANLVAPEFQITNENTAILAANTLAFRAYQYVDSAGKKHNAPHGYEDPTNATTVFLHTASWESLADNPPALVDRLSLVLMGGRMPQAMKNLLIDYIGKVPATTADYRGRRVIEAVSQIISSPQYSVQY